MLNQKLANSSSVNGPLNQKISSPISPIILKILTDRHQRYSWLAPLWVHCTTSLQRGLLSASVTCLGRENSRYPMLSKVRKAIFCADDQSPDRSVVTIVLPLALSVNVLKQHQTSPLNYWWEVGWPYPLVTYDIIWFRGTNRPKTSILHLPTFVQEDE